MCALRILQHYTEIAYHNVPSDHDFSEELRSLETIHTSSAQESQREPPLDLLPKRDAINELMTQLSASDFPELVEQILIDNLHHKRGDITDGPGDESRDIHTLTEMGKRHLTQCRHTQSLQKANLDRNDLDKLWAATIRLKYDEVLIVTTSDLTPPAKACYLNGDYDRPGLPRLQVWNGRDLWTQISSNQNILNRWFKGLAQLHTVRRFSFKAVPVRMPARAPMDVSENLEALITTFNDSGYETTQTGSVWKLEAASKIVFTRKWFTSISNIFMPCSIAAPHDLLTAPISILEFHVLMKDQLVDPESVQKELASLILKSWNPQLPDKWISVLMSTVTAPVYLHDTQEVVLTPLAGYCAYVLLEDQCLDEISAAALPGTGFSKPRQDELLFVDSKNAMYSVNYAQPIQVPSDDSQKVILFRTKDTLSRSLVFSVKYRNHFQFSMALASAPMTTLVLEDDAKSLLYFCFTTKGQEDRNAQSDIMEFARSLNLQNIKYNKLDSKERSRVRKRLLSEPEPNPATHQGIDNISYILNPIDFSSRAIQCMMDIDVPQPCPQKQRLAFELLKYKLKVQLEEGFDEGFPTGENVISYRQMKNLLFRPNQLTGKTALNIEIANYPSTIAILLIALPDTLETLESALQKASTLFAAHVTEIRKLMAAIKE